MTALNALMCIFVILLVIVAVPWMLVDLQEKIGEWRRERGKRK